MCIRDSAGPLWDCLQVNVASQDCGRRAGSPTGQPREAVGRVADQGQVIWDRLWSNAPTLYDAGSVDGSLAAAVAHHYSLVTDALGQILVRRADPDSLHARPLWGEWPGVERVWICTPDKDLAQCVRDERVVMRDRRRQRTIDRAGVVERWGVAPESIPDYLALVGDAADGFPGLAGWGARSAAAVLARYVHLEAIPEGPGAWGVTVRAPASLSAVLRANWSEAMLYRRLATLRTDAPLPQRDPDELRWRGARRSPFLALCAELGLERLAERPHLWQD